MTQEIVPVVQRLIAEKHALCSAAFVLKACQITTGSFVRDEVNEAYAQILKAIIHIDRRLTMISHMDENGEPLYDYDYECELSRKEDQRFDRERIF